MALADRLEEELEEEAKPFIEDQDKIGFEEWRIANIRMGAKRRAAGREPALYEDASDFVDLTFLAIRHAFLAYTAYVTPALGWRIGIMFAITAIFVQLLVASFHWLIVPHSRYIDAEVSRQGD